SGITTSGTIYIDGTVTTNGGSALCGPPATPSGSTCSGKWNPSQGALIMVAVNSQLARPGWKMNGNAEFDVGIYIVGNYYNGGNAFVAGPIPTDPATISGTPASTDVPTPPGTAPGSTSTSPGATTWAVSPGTWQQLKPA